MLKTKDMIKDQKIWAGLNRPNLNTKDADIAVFGIPFDGSVSFRSGAKDAPQALRDITYTIPPTTEYFEDLSSLKIHDLGDFGSSTREELFDLVEGQVAELVKAGRFFTMIGGDHSTTIPVLRGINDAVDEAFGIIHIDAHFDLCNCLNGDVHSHGSTARRALDLEQIRDSESIYFVGIRSIESEELVFMKDHTLNVISAKQLSDIGVARAVEDIKSKMAQFSKIYLTIDIDCLDPAYAAGTGTPQFGGMTSRELLNLLRGIFDLPIIGFDVVEVAPTLDPSLASLFAARKIITECWGHYLRKSK